MALVLDTGPIFAYLDRNDPDYRACRDLIESSGELLVIPAPVLVELDWFVSNRLNPGVLVRFLTAISRGEFEIQNLTLEDYERAAYLCDRYSDSDIGFVDAAVLAVVERLNEPKLATLDHRHFGMLRPRHVDALRLLPE